MLAIPPLLLHQVCLIPLKPRKHRYGKNPAVPVPGTSWVRILPGYRCMRTPGVPIFGQKKKIPIRFWYGLGTDRVGSGTRRGKTKAKRRRFKGNLKPIYLLHPILSHSFSSATPLSLFSAFDSSTAGALGSFFLTSSLYRRRATTLDHLGSEGYDVGSSWIGRGSESYGVEEKCPDEPLFALYVTNMWRTELTGVESLIE